MKILWRCAYYGTGIFVALLVAEEAFFSMHPAAKDYFEVYIAINMFASLGIIACAATMWFYGFQLLVVEAKTVSLKKSALRLMYLLVFNALSGYHLYYLSKRNRRNELSLSWGW